MFFGANPICVIKKSAVQFTGQQAVAARSTCKHFTDTPAVQFGSQDSKPELAVVELPSRDSQASASASVTRKDLEEFQE